MLLLILSFIAPGFMFFKVYHSRKVSSIRTGYIESPLNFVSQSLFVTVFIHLITSLLLTDLSFTPQSMHVFQFCPAYDAMSRIIIYSFGLDEVGQDTAEKLQMAWRQLFENDKTILYYNIIVVLLAMWGARSLRKIVIANDLDLKYVFLRYPNPNYYLLNGLNPFLVENIAGSKSATKNDRGFDYLQAICTMKESGRVIKGILGHYTLTKNSIDNIVIYNPVEVIRTRKGKKEVVALEDQEYMMIKFDNVEAISISHIIAKIPESL